MTRIFTVSLAALFAVLILSACQQSSEPAAAPLATTKPDDGLAPPEAGVPPHRHIQDVIYGRKYGTCLAYDVFIPVNPNGAAIVYVDTGGYVDDFDHIWAGGFVHYLERGYTVFYVVHGSAPKFSVIEQVYDVQRAIKFIRYHAADYGIDPNRMGMTGASAGGYLSVISGVIDSADPNATDPIERLSSKVQAVACFCPPTNLNGNRAPSTRAVAMAATRPARSFIGAMTYYSFMERPRSRISMGKGNPPGESPGAVQIVTDPDKLAEIRASINPIDLMSGATAPTMVIQGEIDKAVDPVATKAYIAKLATLGVPSKYVTVPGSGHHIDNATEWSKQLADWFDIYLAKKT